MKISEKGLKLIKRFEGCSLSAYQDCVGVWTIGYGSTNADKAITGCTIKRGLKINKATAETWLRRSLDTRYGPKVMKYDGVYHWTQNEFDALVSFAYNVGDIDQLTAEGRRTRVEIESAIPRYCKAGGRVVQGLRDRRAAELALFRTRDEQGASVGNPYPEPTGTVASNETAAEMGLRKWIPRGEAVKWVQWELVRLGYDLGAPAVDGVMGKRTDAAVEAFQSGSGLAVDKAVGPKTRAALVKATKKPLPPSASADTPLKEEDKSKQKVVNYLERAARAGGEIYPLCIGKKHGSGVQKRVKNLSQFKNQKELNCHLMVSLALQEAGCLPRGCFITHTPKGSGKTYIGDAVKGTEKLKHCKVYWVNKRFHDLPAKWQAAGVVYIQNSNACMSAGGGKIWSCNKSVGEWYRVRGDYLRTGGYPFTSPILVVLVPQ